jgi:hypothetical protein
MAKAVRKTITIMKTGTAPDAELIALGRRISDLRVRERSSDAECRALLRAKDDAADALNAAEAKADAVGDNVKALRSHASTEAEDLGGLPRVRARARPCLLVG